MKNIFCCICFILIGIRAGAYVNMTRVNPALFIHKPDTNWGSIEIKDELLKQKMIRSLFNLDLLDHKGSKAYDGEAANFDAYYSSFKSKFKLFDLNKDGKVEVVFSGLISEEDDRERFQVFAGSENSMQLIYNELGHLLAYKIHANTKEIILYHHQYPCCENASHTILKLRLTEKMTFHQIKRFFLGREKGDMKGNFFPKKVVFGTTYFTSTKEIELHWSNEKIDTKAWLGRTDKNIIARFEKGTLYKELCKMNGWRFVLVHTPPIVEKNVVINPSNFKDVAIYGWLEID